MPKFYCDYCGVYLTHSSPSGRRQHGKGRKHINNKIDYYSQVMLEQNQSRGQGPLNPYMRPNMLPQQPGQIPLQIPKPLLLGEGLAPGGIQLVAQQLPSINLPGIQPSNITSIQLQNQRIQIADPFQVPQPMQQQQQQLTPNLSSIIPPPNPQQSILGLLSTQPNNLLKQNPPQSLIQQPPQNINFQNLSKNPLQQQQDPEFQPIKLQAIPIAQLKQNKQI